MNPRLPGQRLWMASYVMCLVVFFGLYNLVDLDLVPLPPRAASLAQKLLLAAVLITVVLTLRKLIEVTLVDRVESTVARYNLRQVLRLVAAVLIGLIAISFLFTDWYTALASVGVVSLILGLALQTPLTSFFGWVYIMVRAPYRVGDRIRIDNATGDVINVSYLDTTLWEFGGPYLSTDHPSGRIIKFPNSKVLNTTVYNYSWPLFPFIWNEIKLMIGYQSDLEFVAQTMQEVAAAELGPVMMERVRVFRGLLAQTPVDQLTVQEHPTVVFRTNDNTWLEAILRYVVNPREQGRVKTRLIPKLLARLNAEPDRVLFPGATCGSFTGQLARGKSSHTPIRRPLWRLIWSKAGQTYPIYRQSVHSAREEPPMMSSRRLSNPVSQPQAVAEPYRVPLSESLGLVAMIVIILALPFLYDLALATGFAR